MAPARRQLLKGVASVIGVSSFGTLVTGDDLTRVFVHPTNGLLGDVVDTVTDVGGEVIFEYDNFDFIAADVPESELSELSDATRIGFVEQDPFVDIPDGWDPSLLDLLDPGDDLDCSAHPSQEPNWGWERIGVDGVEYTGADIDVGILDTGIRTDHCTLEVTDGRNFTDPLRPNDYDDNHGHGTHVAGIVGARDDDIGVIGVAPEANLHAAKVLDDNGSGRYSTLVAGIDWCMSNDIEILTMSLGGESESDSVSQAIDTAVDAGHLLLSAAGNRENTQDGSCAEETMTFPATHSGVIATTAMNPDDSLAGYSSVGSAVDLIAPGTDIRSTYVRRGYADASGTSMACPFAAGVAALVWEATGMTAPGSNNDTVRDILESSAEGVLETCEEGDGLVNATSAIAEATGRDDTALGSDPDGIEDVLDRLDPDRLDDEIFLLGAGGVSVAAIAGYVLNRRLRDDD